MCTFSDIAYHAFVINCIILFGINDVWSGHVGEQTNASRLKSVLPIKIDTCLSWLAISMQRTNGSEQKKTAKIRSKRKFILYELLLSKVNKYVQSCMFFQIVMPVKASISTDISTRCAANKNWKCGDDERQPFCKLQSLRCNI